MLRGLVRYVAIVADKSMPASSVVAYFYMCRKKLTVEGAWVIPVIQTNDECRAVVDKLTEWWLHGHIWAPLGCMHPARRGGGLLAVMATRASAGC